MILTLGKIVGAFGIKGWVKVFSETRPREQIFSYSPWTVEVRGQRRQIEVIDGHAQGKGLVARLQGIDDRDAAEALIGASIGYPAEAMPEAGPGEYYWSQLVGLEVRNRQGEDFGTVSRLFETGANDVMVVKGERERLIPFTGDAVAEVDLEQGCIIVDWDADF